MKSKSKEIFDYKKVNVFLRFVKFLKFIKKTEILM